MKNITVLYEPDEIRSYLHQNWHTDLFRREQVNPSSFLHEITQRAALYPLFVYDYSSHPSAATPVAEQTEWAHFSAWWGGIAERSYANDAIHDAYWLHEIYHKGYMTYRPGISFEGFKDKIFRNELNASMASEIELYMYYPEFRRETFPHEIFVDRFLNHPVIMEQWNKDPWGTRDYLRVERRELMLRENRDNPVEYWIHKFAQQNEAWAAIWSRRYDLVEHKMAELRTTINCGGDRRETMDRFMEWLTSREVTCDSEIPFPDEAQAFAGVYRLNARHYRESIARGELGSV